MTEVSGKVPSFLITQHQRNAEINTLWRTCLDLAEKFAVDLELEKSSRAIERLSQPLRLAVAGDAGVGKSSIIAGLTELDILKGFSRGGWIRHHHSKAKILPSFADRAIDAPVLRYLECFESPKLAIDPQEWEDDVVRDADLTLLVFSAENPWSAGSWNWIERHYSELKGQVLLVLTHTDLYELSELQMIEKHMRDIAVQRCGGEVPMVLVGGESSHEELARQIGRRIPNLPDIKARFATAVEVVDVAQARIERVLDRRRRLLRADGGFLEELELEISDLREAELQRLDDELQGGVRSFLNASAKALVFLRGQLSILPRWAALVKGDRLPLLFERKTQQLAAQELELWVTDGFEQQMERLRKHWKSVMPRTEEQLRLKLGAFPREKLVEAKGRRKETILDAVRRTLLKARLREVLLAELKPYRQMIFSWFTLGLLFWLGGAVLGVLGFHQAGLIVVGVALLCALMSILRIKGSAGGVREHMSRRLKDVGSDLNSSLEPVARGEVVSLLAKYRSCFEDVNVHITTSRHDLLPAQEKWRAVYLRLKSIQQDL